GDAAAASHWVGNLPRRGGETHGRPQFEVANGVGSAAGPAGTAPVRTAAAAAARWRLAAVAGRLVAGWWTFATPAGPAAARILPIGPARLAAAPHRPRLDSLRLHTDSDQGARLDTQPPSRRCRGQRHPQLVGEAALGERDRHQDAVGPRRRQLAARVWLRPQ